MKIMKKQFYTKPIFELFNLRLDDAIMASMNDDNFVSDNDII